MKKYHVSRSEVIPRKTKMIARYKGTIKEPRLQQKKQKKNDRLLVEDSPSLKQDVKQETLGC